METKHINRGLGLLRKKIVVSKRTHKNLLTQKYFFHITAKQTSKLFICLYQFENVWKNSHPVCEHESLLRGIFHFVIWKSIDVRQHSFFTGPNTLKSLDNKSGLNRFITNYYFIQKCISFIIKTRKKCFWQWKRRFLFLSWYNFIIVYSTHISTNLY